MDYINTGEFENYDVLREQIADYKLKEQPDTPKKKIEREVYEWSDLEVEKQPRKINYSFIKMKHIFQES